MRSSEQIKPNRKVRRKREWEDTRRPAWVMWVSLACLLALLVTVLALTGSDRMSKPQAINGDALGPDNRESVVEYVERARETLEPGVDGTDGTGSADGTEARWALVTPVAPAGTEALSEIMSDQSDLRVSTLLSGGSQWALPEPAAGHRREDVFAEARELIAANAGTEIDDPSLDVLGVVVHGTPDQLRALAERGDVLAVEALPPDAVFGRFGLRPVAPGTDEDPDAPAAGDPPEDSAGTEELPQ